MHRHRDCLASAAPSQFTSNLNKALILLTKNDGRTVGLAFLRVGWAFWVGGCGASLDDSAEELGLVFDGPGDGGRHIPSFQNNILSILTQRCALAGCHVADGPHGIDLRSYETLQQGGGRHDAIVIARHARASQLVRKIVEGRMPPEAPPLDPAQIQLIIDWIIEGADNN